MVFRKELFQDVLRWLGDLEARPLFCLHMPPFYRCGLIQRVVIFNVEIDGVGGVFGQACVYIDEGG